MKIAAAKRDSLFNLAGTIVIAGLNVSALAGARLVLPMVALGMGANTFQVGLMSAMFTAIPMLSSVRFGRWIDRIGTLFPVVFSCCLIIAASALFILVSTITTLVPVAGLIGAGAFFASAAATRGVSGSNDESKRTKHIAYLVLGYSLFGFLGPIIASASYEHFGTNQALLTIGGLGFLSLCLILVNFHYYTHSSVQPISRVAKRRTSDLFLIGNLRKWIIVNAVFATGQTLYPLVVSLHAVKIGLSPTQAGIILGAFAAGMAVSRTCVSHVIRMLRQETLVTAALLVAAIIYGVFPQIQDFYLLMILSMLLGMPLGIALPISLSLIYGAAPEGRVNESVGLCYSVTSMLQTAAPLILAAIASGPDAIALTWAVSLALVLAAIVAGRARG